MTKYYSLSEKIYKNFISHSDKESMLLDFLVMTDQGESESNYIKVSGNSGEIDNWAKRNNLSEMTQIQFSLKEKEVKLRGYQNEESFLNQSLVRVTQKIAELIGN